MNTRSIHSKFDEDGNVETEAHPLHHMQRKDVWGGGFFGCRSETAAQLCRAPLSGTNQWCHTLRHTCKDDSIPPSLKHGTGCGHLLIAQKAINSKTVNKYINHALQGPAKYEPFKESYGCQRGRINLSGIFFFGHSFLWKLFAMLRTVHILGEREERAGPHRQEEVKTQKSDNWSMNAYVELDQTVTMTSLECSLIKAGPSEGM